MRYAILLVMLGGSVGAPAAGRSSPCPTGTDTLRYREVTESQLILYTPAGTRLVQQSHNTAIALVSSAGGGVSAWYDSLAIKVESIEGVHQPETTALLRQPFELRCEGLGRLTTLRAPGVPPDIRRLSDLTQQFTDFLVRMPGPALRVGVAWTDTLVHVVPEAGGSSRRYTAITSWRVEQDARFGGEQAWILSGRGRLTLDAADSSGASLALSVLAGEEQGRVVLGRDGRLLSRTKEGTLNGQLTIRAGSSARNFPQAYTYQSRITYAS